MHPIKIEAIKFAIGGTANFILTFIVFTALLKILSINYLISLASAWVLGTLFSYVLNFLWVFKPEQKIQFRARFFKYYLAGLISLLTNMLLLSVIVEHNDFDPFYVQIFLIPFVVIFNFVTAKYWSLRVSL